MGCPGANAIRKNKGNNFYLLLHDVVDSRALNVWVDEDLESEDEEFLEELRLFN